MNEVTADDLRQQLDEKEATILQLRKHLCVLSSLGNNQHTQVRLLLQCLYVVGEAVPQALVIVMHVAFGEKKRWQMFRHVPCVDLLLTMHAYMFLNPKGVSSLQSIAFCWPGNCQDPCSCRRRTAPIAWSAPSALLHMLYYLLGCLPPQQ